MPTTRKMPIAAARASADKPAHVAPVAASRPSRARKTPTVSAGPTNAAKAPDLKAAPKAAKSAKAPKKSPKSKALLVRDGFTMPEADFAVIAAGPSDHPRILIPYIPIQALSDRSPPPGRLNAPGRFRACPESIVSRS